jgi:hypothetical protein
LRTNERGKKNSEKRDTEREALRKDEKKKTSLNREDMIELTKKDKPPRKV